MKKYIRVDVGPDGFASSTTLHDSSSTQSVLSIIYPKNFGESISSVTIEFIKNTNTTDDTVLGPGKEIRIWHKDTLAVGNDDADRLFRGYINIKEIDGPRVRVTVDDLFVKAMWNKGTTTEDYESATAVKTVLTALCTAAGLTASNNAATPAPLNVEKFYSNNQNIFERISYILNLIGWYGYYDPTTTQTIVFQPKSAGALQTFDNTTNTSIINRMNWKNDATGLINDVTLIGGSNQITTTENKTPTGNKGYTLTAGSVYPENVIITGTDTQVSSVPKTTWDSNEFTVLTNGIWFTRGFEPDVDQGTLHIQFTYQTSLSGNPSTASNAGSQTAYVKRSKVIRKSDTVNSTDLDNWAAKLVNSADTVPFWEIPIQEVSFSVMDSVTYPILGSKADVTDLISGRSLTYDADGSIIYMIEQQWPRPGTRILISTKPLKNPMQQTTVQDSVEKINIEMDKINPTSLMRKDASTPLLGSQDFCGYELRNIRLENSAVPPDNLGYGGLYYNSGNDLPYYNKAGTWTLFGSGGGTWGSITGTLSDQTDLQNALNAKLSLTAGIGTPLTGHLYINMTTPEIHLEEGGDTRGGLYVDASDNVILAHAKVGGSESLILGTIDTTGGPISLEPRNAGVALSVAYNLITSTVHIHMSDQAIDLRTDNVHTIGYASGTNSLDIQSYDELQFLLTQNGGVVPMSIMTDGIRIWEALFIRKNQATDTVYIVDDATANMEFHVGTGKVFEFIVG